MTTHGNNRNKNAKVENPKNKNITFLVDEKTHNRFLKASEKLGGSEFMREILNEKLIEVGLMK